MVPRPCDDVIVSDVDNNLQEQESVDKFGGLTVNPANPGAGIAQ